MNVAFLITAYNQPQYLRRLVKALEHPNFYFFIHIDLKADISPFTSLDFGKNTFFLEGDDRIRVYHGGFTQTESAINLLRVAARTKDFDYFFFLSGSDYPIKSTRHIYNFLKTNYPTNFIDFYPLVGSAHASQYIHKYYFDDYIGRLPKKIEKYARIGSNMLLGQLPDRAFPKGITPFRGSSWFCINKDTTRYILDYLGKKESRALVDFFKRSWASGETFFHTIILNSVHARECRYYDPDIYGSHAVNSLSETWLKPNKGYLHYIDWSRDREDCAVLTMQDFEDIKNSEFLFGRKFFEKFSGELLEHLDKHFLEETEE